MNWDQDLYRECSQLDYSLRGKADDTFFIIQLALRKYIEAELPHIISVEVQLSSTGYNEGRVATLNVYKVSSIMDVQQYMDFYSWINRYPGLDKLMGFVYQYGTHTRDKFTVVNPANAF